MTHRSRLYLCLALVLLFAGAVRSQAGESSPYGVNIHAPTGADLNRLLDSAQAAGIGWVRIDFVWAYVEPQRGVYDWSTYDPIAAAAKARGIAVYATIAYTPAWATSGPPVNGVPDNPADWADVCRRAASRYADSIRYWGMWNEPNETHFWAGSQQEYLDVILKTGADAIHAGNPQAKVGGPELAHLTSGSSDWFSWLQQAIVQAGDRLDFVTHHVYDRDGSHNVTDDLDQPTLFGGQPALWNIVPPSVKEVLQATGWLGRPFWLTETGWATDQVSEQQQASYYSGLLNDWFGGQPNRDWVGKVFFYEIQDDAAAGVPKWGILRADGTSKPAYDAYHAFIAGHTAEVDGARLSTADIPNAMEAGQTIQVSVAMTNVGNTVWTAAGGYKLGAVGDSDPFAGPRQVLPPGASIPPGQTAVFTFPFTAPAKPGSYLSDWEMVREGVHFFGDTYAKTVTVTAAPAPSQRSLALLGGRFRVAVSWRDQHGNKAGYGRAVTDSDETGFFWFFSSANVELVVKLLDGRPLNGRFWFFYGALSDVEYWIDVTDTATGQVREYHNAPGNICGRGDTAAFPVTAGTTGNAQPALAALRARGITFRGGQARLEADPASAAVVAAAATASCSPDAQTLCLLGGRFQVSVDWHDQHNARNGKGIAISGTDETGTFWFFDPGNVELVVKLLDGRALNGKFWVFYGALSDVEYWVNVKDLATGTLRTYHNAPGNICGVGDTGAF